MNFLKQLFIRNVEVDDKTKYQFNQIEDFVEKNIDELIQSSLDDLGKSYEEVINAKKRKELFKKQLNLCGLGDISAKKFIKSWISDLITQKYGVNEDNIDYAINFDFPSIYDKFCIIMNKYFKKYGYDALSYFIHLNKLDEIREIEQEVMYAVTNDDIDKIYDKELIGMMKLSFEEKLDVLVQRIYERTHGLSVIDEIRDMNCDGISIGVSGIPIDFVPKINDINAKNNTSINYPLSYESVWLYFEGKEIHFKFMSFGSQRELERICRKIYRFNNQKQFTKSDGFIFNNMADFSRIAVYRPPYAEGWGAFIRKFDIDGDLDVLIKGKNSDIVKELILYLIKAKENICFSGQQGAGKTTMLVGAIKKMYGNVTLRVWESYFETFLRIKMPNRNILTLRETEYINGEKALDSLKKSNGQVTVISEAADDRSKAYVIKGALAASECVLWTDHSETPDDLVQSHRNACINVGAFRDENKAEEQVLSVLGWDVHLKKDADGKRYIERVTEFIRLDTEGFNKGTDILAFHENATKFFEKQTNAKKYEAINLVEYDVENERYIVKNNMSEFKMRKILNNLMKHDRNNFIEFINRLRGDVIE